MKYLKSTVLLTVVFLMLFYALSFAQDSQSSRHNDNYLPYKHIWHAKEGAASEDSIGIVAGGLYYSEPFRHWKRSIVHMYVNDSGATDSLKFIVNLMQWAYSNTAPTIADSLKFTNNKTLSWYSHTSSTTTDTITSGGYYTAWLSKSWTDSTCLPAVYDMFQCKPFTGNAKLSGVEAKFIVTGWVDKDNL